MTLTQLQIFLTLIQTGSFTKTGEVLGMSQSAVSHAVASLESEFDVPLILREHRNTLTLTGAGERLTVHIREIVRRVNLIMEEISFRKEIETGTIRIGSSPAATLEVLPKILAAFRDRHPDIEITFIEGTTEDLVKWSSIRVIDVGLTTSLEPLENAVVLFRDWMVALLPVSSPLPETGAVHLTAMGKTPLILSKSDSGSLVQDFLLKHGMDSHLKYEVNDFLAAIKLVQEGVGITVVPQSLVETVNCFSKIRIHPLEPAISVTVNLIAPPFDETSPAVRAFTEIAQSFHIKQQGEDSVWPKESFAN